MALTVDAPLNKKIRKTKHKSEWQLLIQKTIEENKTSASKCEEESEHSDLKKFL